MLEILVSVPMSMWPITVHPPNGGASNSGKFPYKIDKGLLVFTGEGKDLFPFGSVLEFDARRRETAYMAPDYWTGPNIQATSIGPRQVRVVIPKFKGTPGNVLVFGAASRNSPRITTSDSADDRIEAVSIYHCAGMGVIAQRSRDVEVDRIRVTPRPAAAASSASPPTPRSSSIAPAGSR